MPQSLVIIDACNRTALEAKRSGAANEFDGLPLLMKRQYISPPSKLSGRARSGRAGTGYDLCQLEEGLKTTRAATNRGWM